MTRRRSGRLGAPLTILIALPIMVTCVAGLAAAATGTAAGTSAGTASRAETPPVSELLLEGVTLNFDGDLKGADAVWRRLRELAPDDPAGPVHQVDTLFWRQVFDERGHDFDAPILAGIEEAKRLAEERLERDRNDAEAHYWLGRALMLEARFELVRGRFLRAGSRGEAGRKALERALALSPDLTDAKLPLGMYYYYAAALPKALKVLSWLWFVPEGDSVLGLAYLEEARASTSLTRWDAAFILLSIYTYLEPDSHDRALEIAGDLYARFPANTLLSFELIEVHGAMKSYEAVIAQALLLEATVGDRFHDAGRRSMARIWRAGSELELGRTDAAWGTLSVFDTAGPAKPSWASAWLQLTRGRIRDIEGARDEALVWYRRVVALEEPHINRRAKKLAEDALQQPYQLELPQIAAAGAESSEAAAASAAASGD